MITHELDLVWCNGSTRCRTSHIICRAVQTVYTLRGRVYGAGEITVNCFANTSTARQKIFTLPRIQDDEIVLTLVDGTSPISLSKISI